MNQIKRVVTVVGDANKVNTWSGTPYFFRKAGQQLDFFSFGLSLEPEKLKINRVLWNWITWLKTGQTGGFQYSQIFLKKLFNQVKLDSDKLEIISHFPLLPPSPWKNNWIVNYYIDATLRQNFEEYGLASKVAKKVRQQALQQEQENYSYAKRIICMSCAAAKSVVEDYSIASSKVYVIPGGANLDEDSLLTISNQFDQPDSLNPLRLGFIGKDWKRKGLPYLIEVAEVLDQRKIDVEIVVIGPSHQEIPTHQLIQPIGFVDKSKEIEKFVEIVRSFHFGCLFSSAEAFGISNRECLRLGVPVLATDIGGIPDTVPEGNGFLFKPNTSPKIVADLLESFVNNPSYYYELRDKIQTRIHEFSWYYSIQSFINTWQNREENLYIKK